MCKWLCSCSYWCFTQNKIANWFISRFVVLSSTASRLVSCLSITFSGDREQSELILFLFLLLSHCALARLSENSSWQQQTRTRDRERGGKTDFIWKHNTTQIGNSRFNCYIRICIERCAHLFALRKFNFYVFFNFFFFSLSFPLPLSASEYASPPLTLASRPITLLIRPIFAVLKLPLFIDSQNFFFWHNFHSLPADRSHLVFFSSPRTPISQIDTIIRIQKFTMIRISTYKVINCQKFIILRGSRFVCSANIWYLSTAAQFIQWNCDSFPFFAASTVDTDTNQMETHKFCLYLPFFSFVSPAINCYTRDKRLWLYFHRCRRYNSESDFGANCRWHRHFRILIFAANVAGAAGR